MEKKTLGFFIGTYLGVSSLFYGCGTEKKAIIEQTPIEPLFYTNIVYLAPETNQQKQTSSTNLEQKTNQVKPLTSSNFTSKSTKKEYFKFPLEGGKIMIRIAQGDGWKNFKNALDLYTLSKNKARLNDQEIYKFIRPFDKGYDDIFNIPECIELRRRARKLYDESILGDIEKENKSDERNLEDVEPDFPYQKDSN